MTLCARGRNCGESLKESLATRSIRRPPAFSGRPKVCLHDTGLSAALAGFTPAHATSIGGREYYGALVEEFVALELHKQQGWSTTPFTLFHFRDLDGLEVDIIIELADGRLLALEVKTSTSITEKSWTNRIRFKDRFPDRNITGACLHAGTQTETPSSCARGAESPRAGSSGSSGALGSLRATRSRSSRSGTLRC